MSSYRKKELSKTIHSIPDYRIGKRQITENFLEDVKKGLKKKKSVKIRILKSIDKEKDAFLISEIIRETSSELVDKKGRTFVLAVSKRK